jgi:hypothetical protein
MKIVNKTSGTNESSALTARQRLKFDKQNEKLNLLRVVNVGILYFELTMIGKISQIWNFYHVLIEVIKFFFRTETWLTLSRPSNLWNTMTS